MTTRRQIILALGAGSLGVPLALAASARVGFLGTESASEYASNLDALRAGLRELGYTEGTNLVLETRWANGKNDRLPALAAELVKLKVDVLVTHGTPGTLAAKHATSTIPIVMTTSGDAAGTGLVKSLARPGGNVTGMTSLLPEVSAKRLQLLKEALPRMTRLAVLFNPINPAFATDIAGAESAAKAMKIGVQRFGVRGPDEFEGAFASMAEKRVDAVMIHQDGMLNANPKAAATLARKHRLPSIGFKEFGEAGGLIGYGVNFLEMYRRSATYVDKLIRGAKAADLPIEQPTNFELVINLQTAKALGVTIPRALLLRADRVIQ